MIERNKFESVKASHENEKWDNMISRKNKLYLRGNDIRSNFERDYTRIIHSKGYRRMKSKTQVFFSPESDHICTRIEHVTHVESISHSIANFLGLNTELTKAIAIAHDIGHSPFGHKGERILSKLMQEDINIRFWHEKNGVNIVENIELLEDDEKCMQNLNLTYAVRDGIISHCGEIDENSLKPRDEFIDLQKYTKPNEYMPYTWEGCVVKIADKISYLGRDITDAISVGILDENLEQLYDILNKSSKNEVINNTVIINKLVYDLCENSSVQNGLCFSDKTFEMLNEIKRFNYKYIYLSDRLKPSNRYFELLLTEIYNLLKSLYNKEKTLDSIIKAEKIYPKLMNSFKNWIKNYWNLERDLMNKNDVIYDMNNFADYIKAVISYISGMTDNFAIEMYNEIIGF